MNNVTEQSKIETDVDLAGQAERCVMRLRQYNAWRRGSDEIEQPDHKELGELIDLSASLLEYFLSKNTLKVSNSIPLINPVTKPRYDEVFNSGLEMLNDA